MEKDKLSQLWEAQHEQTLQLNPDSLKKLASRQRKGQYLTLLIIGMTFLIVGVYALIYALGSWNNFSLGLLLMLGSLGARIGFELFSLYKKEAQLIAMDPLRFQEYLKRHYRLRLRVNYWITPLCFGIYLIGFVLLLPYFKQAFSSGFYNYLLISGFGSILLVGIIIARSVIKEQRFLKSLL
ncbi:hypothetical protein [Gilvibacter sediminis]|uniref:hypothetical protein n=1 Tax=Gilvibacter sediminis TaxID=379071 RepID=UPI0023501E13|nr:hypothetical protein [Gilvibacter sediminis]MDC7998945.1 hypothetical protein [Gilvibacter sediminis]